MDVISNYVTSRRLWQCAALGVVTIVIMRRLTRPSFLSLTRKFSAEGKTILITGANCGIGLAAAIEFAKRNARVIMACRDTDKAKKAAFAVREKTNKGTLVLKHLDLASQASVVAFAKDILETEEKLDILVNNAGVMGVPHSLTEDGIESTFAINHVSHFLLTNMLLELLEKAWQGRIIMVSSMLYKYGHINFDDINGEKEYNSMQAYSQSKLANILFSNELSRRLKGSKVTVNALTPGMVKTGLARYKLDGAWWKSVIYNTLGSVLLRTPQQGAETIVYCALNPNLCGVTGKFFRDCREKDTISIANDSATASRLWQLCENLTAQLN